MIIPTTWIKCKVVWCSSSSAWSRKRIAISSYEVNDQDVVRIWYINQGPWQPYARVITQLEKYIHPPIHKKCRPFSTQWATLFYGSEGVVKIDTTVHLVSIFFRAWHTLHKIPGSATVAGSGGRLKLGYWWVASSIWPILLLWFLSSMWSVV